MLEQPRNRTGQWKAYAPSAADVVLVAPAEPALFDVTRISVRDRAKLQAHLDSVDPNTGSTFAETYRAFAPEAVSEDLVWVRRGAPRELRWRFHNAEGRTVDVPAVVAAATTVPDTTDPLSPATHARDRAHRKWQKLAEQRSRRRARVEPADRYARVAEENAAYGHYLTAEAALIAAKAAAAQAAFTDLTSASEPFTDAFIREHDRHFDADRAGVTLPPLDDRIEQARQAAFRHSQAARKAAAHLRAWNSTEYVQRRAAGQVTQLPAAHTQVYEYDPAHPVGR
ncbi:hypothetical protein [Agromyces humi]|uniref:hypothetical protein n=1 Tax=Agromyces humi TaxID=1766800 RepID=UPI00135CAFD7|nr:hypothetical protein [Agromyces humi]